MKTERLAAFCGQRHALSLFRSTLAFFIIFFTLAFLYYPFIIIFSFLFNISLFELVLVRIRIETNGSV
jgi:hypothetical protein